MSAIVSSALSSTHRHSKETISSLKLLFIITIIIAIVSAQRARLHLISVLHFAFWNIVNWFAIWRWKRKRIRKRKKIKSNKCYWNIKCSMMICISRLVPQPNECSKQNNAKEIYKQNIYFTFANDVWNEINDSIMSIDVQKASVDPNRSVRLSVSVWEVDLGLNENNRIACLMFFVHTKANTIVLKCHVHGGCVYVCVYVWLGSVCFLVLIQWPRIFHCVHSEKKKPTKFAK